MLKKRLIPCIVVKDGFVVKSMNFKDFQVVGKPLISVEYFNRWAVDEIVLIDISRKRFDPDYDRAFWFDVIRGLSKECFVPLTVGGGIKSVEDIRAFLRAGADKVCVNTFALKNPDFVAESSKTFGSQCIVVSIDVKKNSFGKPEVFSNSGKEATGLNPVDWAEKVESLGAGEIFLNSIDRDGSLEGYDLDLVKSVSESVSIPVIACGGVGKWQDLVDGLNIGKASAVSAANIFHFTEQSTKVAKRVMAEAGIDVRH